MRHFLITVCLVLGLGGCATEGPPLSKVGDQEKAWLAHLAASGWQFQGRIGVRGEGNWHGNLRWSHRGREDVLTIGGPFGQGGVQIRVADSWLRIRYQNGEVRESLQPRVLLAEILGVPVPIQALHHWVLGLPASGPAHMEYGPRGRLDCLRQAGWEIRYLEYRPAGLGALPGKITLSGPGGVRLKLIIDRWEIGRGRRS